MKKILFILITVCLLFSIVGCNKIKESDNFKIISYIEQEEDDKVNLTIKEDDILPINTFAYITTKNILDYKDNSVYSPISLYMALSMLAEGANGNTLEELKTLLGINSLSVLQSTNFDILKTNTYKNKDGKAKIANSYWIDLNTNVKENYINTLKDKYFASGFKCIFDSEAKSNMIKWINDNTYDFLNVKEEDINTKDIVLMLINTIYFENKWKEEFKKSNNTKDTFHTYTSDVETTFMHHTVDDFYYEYNGFIACQDSFKNGNTITYILPNDGITIEELIVNNLIDQYINGSIYYTLREITYSVPKFKYQNKLNLNDNLKELGLNDVFDRDLADFSNISDTKLFLNYVQQICGIEIDNEGVKAAAMTNGGMQAESMPREPVEVKLDRPFMYIIKDSNGVILFTGCVNNPNE